MVSQIHRKGQISDSPFAVKAKESGGNFLSLTVNFTSLRYKPCRWVEILVSSLA